MSAAHLQWPVEKFFWAVLDEPGWRATGPLPEGLRETLADDVPVDPAALHAVGAPLGDGRVLVCAARREDLFGIPRETLSLTPGGIPEFGAGVDGTSLNLLVGEFEPRPVRAARRRTGFVAVAAVLTCAALVSIGLLRRAAAWDQSADALRAAADQLAQAHGPNLAAEVDRLRGALTRRAAAPADAGSLLAAVLLGWPSDVGCTAHSVRAGPDGAAISVSVEGDATPFLTGLRAPSGWALDEPQISAGPAGTRISLRLRAAEEGR
jgi:hypothetical protein